MHIETEFAVNNSQRPPYLICQKISLILLNTKKIPFRIKVSIFQT